jgi:hypothetical protein
VKDEMKDRDEAFIDHLKEEINRLVADGGKAQMNKPKAAPKNNIRAPKCKLRRMEGLGNVISVIKLNTLIVLMQMTLWLKVFKKVLFTECLTNNPVLGLEVIMDGSDVQDDEQRSMAIANNQSIRDEIEQTFSEIVDDIIVEQVTGEIQVTEVLRCEECDFETMMKIDKVCMQQMRLQFKHKK